MIELFKLVRLPHTQKVRKIIKILELLEAETVSISGEDTGPSFWENMPCDLFYIDGLCKHIAELYSDDSSIVSVLKRYAESLQRGTVTAVDCRVLFNTLRHALYRQSGVQPSEWDLIAPGQRYGTVADLPAADASLISRPFYRGVYVYAEDIRAPFNLGSIFRTAEAFGAERLLLSEACVSPDQPRARRSAMGCTDFLPWEYCPLTAIPEDLPVFALETGGIPITSFRFPRRGIVLLGSEELGLTAEALQKVSAGVVSIPMKGVKASLNVAVAFGILMQYWTAALRSDDCR